LCQSVNCSIKAYDQSKRSCPGLPAGPWKPWKPWKTLKTLKNAPKNAGNPAHVHKVFHGQEGVDPWQVAKTPVESWPHQTILQKNTTIWRDLDLVTKYVACSAWLEWKVLLTGGKDPWQEAKTPDWRPLVVWRAAKTPSLRCHLHTYCSAELYTTFMAFFMVG
jgi:hypothetical protein